MTQEGPQLSDKTNVNVYIYFHKRYFSKVRTLFYLDARYSGSCAISRVDDKPRAMNNVQAEHVTAAYG